METFLHSIVHFFGSKPFLVGLTLFGLRMVLLTALEKRDPAHVVSYRNVLPRDIFVTLIIGFVVLPIADFLDSWIVHYPVLPQWVLEWPLTIRIIIYLVLAD